MKIVFYEYQYWKMEHELHLIRERVENIEDAAVQSIRVVMECLSEYREYFKVHGLEKRSEKIHFFKILKPKVVSRLIYYTEAFNLWNERPRYENGPLQKLYWTEKKERIWSYVREHSFFVQYLVNDSTWLDTQLFLPENRDQFYHWGIPNELDSVALYDDPEFSTSHDHIAARLLAYGRLYRFCDDQLGTWEKVADFRGGAETTFDVVPLLQRYKSLASTGNPGPIPLHIPRHEHYRLLDRFMNHNLTSSAKSRRRRNARMSKRMRRKIRRFLHVWAAENRDKEYEDPQEKESETTEE